MTVHSWEEVQRPVGPQPIPAWCKGLHIDWGDRHDGAPEVKLKCYEDVGNWPGKVWRDEGGGAYTTRSEDGRVERHYHKGTISEHFAWTVLHGGKPGPNGWQLSDPKAGESREAAAHRAAATHLAFLQGLKNLQGVALEPRVKSVLATTQQDGYAGRAFPVALESGRELFLCGPWHGGSPAGTKSVIVTNLSRYKPRGDEPWHCALGMFGVAVTEDLYLRLLARFAPEVPVARVEWLKGEFSLQPFKPEWGEPKGCRTDRRIAEAIAARKTAKEPA